VRAGDNLRAGNNSDDVERHQRTSWNRLSAAAIDNSFKMTLGRRYSDTGPIESAELRGLDILHNFARFLYPALDNAAEPPKPLTVLVEAGHRGFKTGRGAYDWSQRDGASLASRRADRLFQNIAEDAKKNA